MQTLIAAQELARKNNENAAVLAAYCRRRELRRGPFGRKPKSRREAKALDELDPSSSDFDEASWREAEREARPVRAVGFFVWNPQLCGK